MLSFVISQAQRQVRCRIVQRICLVLITTTRVSTSIPTARAQTFVIPDNSLSLTTRYATHRRCSHVRQIVHFHYSYSLTCMSVFLANYQTSTSNVKLPTISGIIQVTDVFSTFLDYIPRVIYISAIKLCDLLFYEITTIISTFLFKGTLVRFLKATN